MLFENRREAGRLLAARILEQAGRDNSVVLGIPRGGVIVAAEVASRLNAPLDVFVTHKLGAPGNPELAIGAIAGDGTTLLDQHIIREFGIPREYVERERDTQLRELKRRAERYRQGRLPIPLKDRHVILCDDGIATGATAFAALESLRTHQPARVILAVPIGPRQSMQALAEVCDEVVVLATPEPFYAVGRFYAQFEQITDEQVIEALQSRPASDAEGTWA